MKLALPSLLLLSLAGCGGSIAPASDAGTGTDTGVTDTGTGGGECPVKTPGKNIWDVTPADCLQGIILADQGGGFGPPPPPGSQCDGGSKFSLTIATRDLSWERCAFAPNNQPWKLEKGQRTITPAELASVAAAMRKVTVINVGNLCGADKPLLTVTAVTPKYALEYVDSFYQCNGGGKLYVDNIDGAFSAVGLLAP